MHIIEEFLHSRSANPEECEDFLVKSDNFLAVIDGVTDKHGFPYRGGKKGGRFAGEIVAQEIEQLPEEISAIEAIRHLGDTLRQAVLEEHDENTPFPGATLAIYSRHRREVWSIGSVHIILNGMNYSQSLKIDEVLADTRAAYTEALLLDGKSRKRVLEEDPGREIILPVLSKQHHFANNQNSYFAYSLLNGSEIPSDLIQILSVEEGSEVVLATDGYPEIFPTLYQSEKNLQERLDRDPLMISPPAQTKGKKPESTSFDDRTFLRFQVKE
jgi:hypothetical protein